MPKVTQIISPETTWSSGGLSYGGLSTKYKLELSINEAFTKLTLKITCLKFDVTPSPSYMTGLNSYFIHALVWPIHDLPEPSNTYLTIVHPPHYDESLSDAQLWNTSKEDISKASFGKSWSAIEQNAVVAVGVNQSGAAYKSGMHTVGSTKTLTMDLKPSDFDSNGMLKYKFVLFSSTRFGNYAGDDSQGWDWIDVNGIQMKTGDVLVSTEGYGPRFDDFDYFPGEIKKGSIWKSHNRSNGGRACIKKTSGWRNIKCNINPNSKNNKAHIKDSSWVRQDLIGEDANA